MFHSGARRKWHPDHQDVRVSSPGSFAGAGRPFATSGRSPSWSGDRFVESVRRRDDTSKRVGGHRFAPQFDDRGPASFRPEAYPQPGTFFFLGWMERQHRDGQGVYSIFMRPRNGPIRAGGGAAYKGPPRNRGAVPAANQEAL